MKNLTGVPSRLSLIKKECRIVFIPENRGSRKGNLDPSEVGIEPAGGGVEPAAPTGGGVKPAAPTRGHPPLPNISVLPLPVLLYCLPLLYILLPMKMTTY